MPRKPVQVHIYLYRENNDEYEFAVFQRKDLPVCWQGVCGGLENDETLEQGARRELFEEAGVVDKPPLMKLDNISYLPDYLFAEKERKFWGEDIIVIPMYFFAMPYDGEVKLSDEHLDVRWLNYEEAYKLIYFRDQQIALYELNERLLRGERTAARFL